MLAWAVPVLLIVLVGLLAAAAAWPDADGKPRIGIILAAGAIAPLLIWTSLTTADNHGRFGDLRLSVMSIKLAPDAIDGASIGGDRVHDVLLVGDLSASLVTLKHISAQQVGLSVARPMRGEFAGAVAFEPIEVDWWKRPFAESPRFVGERAVRPGEVFCPNGCDNPCRIHLTPSDNRLGVDNGAGPRMETRGSIVSWGPTQRVYPLRTFAAGGSCDDALLGESDKNGLPVTAFLFRHGGFDQRLYAMFLDAADASQPDAVLTVGGPAVRIHFYRVDYTTGGASEEHDRPSRVVERRSVTARLDPQGNLLISFDTPEDLQLSAPAIANVMAAKPNDDIVLPIDNDRSSGRPFVGDSTLQFRSLGGQLAETALGRLLLHPEHKTKTLAPYFSVVGGGQTRNVSFGERFTLGSSYSAEFSLVRLDRDHGVLGLIGFAFLALAAAALLAATWPQRRTSVSVFVLLTLAEVLTAFRVLIAVSGAYVDPAASRAFIVPSALFAYLAVPFLIAHVAGARRSLLASFAYVALIAAFGFVAGRDFGLDKTSWIVGALVFIALVADAFTQPALPLTIRGALSGVGARIRGWIGDAGTWLRGRQLYPAEAVRPLAWLVALIVIRLALLLVGVKEGVPLFGFRVAVSTIYLPIALILLARLLVALRGDDDRALWRPLVWSIAVGLVFATPIAARDTGFIIFALGTTALGIIALFVRRADATVWLTALVGLPLGFLLLCYVLLHSFVVDTTTGFAIAAVATIVAVVLGLTAMHLSERLSRIAAPLPLVTLAGAAVLLVVPFLFLGDWMDAVLIDAGAIIVFAVLWQRPVAAWAIPIAFAVALGFSFQLPILATTAAPDRSAARELDDQMQKTQNILRIWYSVRPGDVGDFATSSAQNLGAVMAHLHDYGACPQSQWPGCLAGHGYLAIPRPTVLAPYQLNDNVTAIHLIAPFGRLGAATFLLLLGAAAYFYTRQSLKDGEPPPLRLAGIAALWTIFGAALYMILANLEVLPFTGKNVYFLAASSGSDLLEGTILIAVAMIALKRRTA